MNKADLPSCAFCDRHGATFEHTLRETAEFVVVCDPYPLIEGHLLIIPKKHIPCIGSCAPSLFREFEELYKELSAFLHKTYGKVSSFEHGDIGQSVPHAHMHLLPCDVDETRIVTEGSSHLEPLRTLQSIRSLFGQRSHYLFFSRGEKYWVVDSDLAKPRFFRDRLAIALGRPQRANWKAMSSIAHLMEEASKEIEECKKRWHASPWGKHQ